VCGIAGVVDFDTGLTGGQEITRAMTETMACRGPDAHGTWCGRHVVLGHRRLAVIDLDGGAQPMVTDDAGTVNALTYSGEVYNFEQLRLQLQSAGHEFRTRSDTEVVLRAYRQWGAEFVTHLTGMYAFALWDGRQQELLLVRDRMGIKPLYYAPTPGGVLFGSEPKAILAHPGFRPVVDEDGLRELMSAVRTPGSSIWRGMRELKPGSMAVVGRGGVRVRTYWSLDATPFEGDVDTAIELTRGLLDEAVSSQLVSDVPLCTLLSGGLDSSAITALAAARLRTGGGGPVRSFSVDFEGYTESFKPDEVRPDPDAPFVKEVVAHVASAHTSVMLDSHGLMDEATRTAVMRAYDLPAPHGDMSTSMHLLFRAIRQQSTVALSGEAADEVFGGYAWFHDEDAVRANTFPWLAATRQFRRFCFLRPDLNRRLALDDFQDQLYADAIAEVPLLAGADAAERRMREVTYLALTRYVPTLLERKDRMSMATGLEVRVPYCDHRLVQFAFSVPWKIKTFDGRGKSLLRAAVADLLPPSVLRRRKSHYPSTQDNDYGELVRREFLDLMARPAAGVFELADRRTLGWLAKDMGGSASELFTRRCREQVLALDRWLTEYKPELVIQP
jgi:asparagine synthase (glutamine-hydrolysing)